MAVTNPNLDHRCARAFPFEPVDEQVDPAEGLARVLDALAPGGIVVMYDAAASGIELPTRRRLAVIGCGRGELVIALAWARPADVIAGFDSDPIAIADARRSAIQHRVADRVTFEVATHGRLLGAGYDLIYLPQPTARPTMSEPGGTT